MGLDRGLVDSNAVDGGRIVKTITYRMAVDFHLSPEEVERLVGDGIAPGSLAKRVEQVLGGAELGEMKFRGEDGTRYVFDLESVDGEVEQ